MAPSIFQTNLLTLSCGIKRLSSGALEADAGFTVAKAVAGSSDSCGDRF